MQVAAALLCDSAEVREGLLFLLAGGITRVYRDEFPAPLGVSLALVVELHRMERERPHELAIDIVDADGAMLARINGAFQVGETNAEALEGVLVPVALDLRAVGVAHAGWHSIEVSIDSQHQRSIPFLVGPRPTGPGPVAGPPTTT